MNEGGTFLEWFQQGGPPHHYEVNVRQWLDEQFPRHWIGPQGPKEKKYLGKIISNYPDASKQCIEK